MKMEKQEILSIKGVKVHFPIKRGLFRKTAGYVKAVDGVSLSVYRGETLGIVGESGCGKTTLGKTILRLQNSSDGSVLYQHPEKGAMDLCSLSEKAMLDIRQRLQIVFQDPHSSLNPAFTIFGSLEDPLKMMGISSRSQRRRIIGDLLEAVNLRREYMDRYPHEFSGGQRQRIGIARALSVQPELIICDEAVSALDVSIQAQVLKLLKQLKEERGLSYLFITHDLSVVEYISDRIAVMYLGKLVELAENSVLYKETAHPYTQALLSAIPVADPDRKKERIVLEGDVPNPANPPSGCPFHPRCPRAEERCREEIPRLMAVGQKADEHLVACHYPIQI